MCDSYSSKCYHLIFLVTCKTRPLCIFVSHLYFIICGLFTICQPLYHLSFMLLLFFLFIFMKSVMGAWSSCMFCISFPILQIWTCLKNCLLLHVGAFFKVQVLWLQKLFWGTLLYYMGQTSEKKASIEGIKPKIKRLESLMLNPEDLPLNKNM